MKIALASDHAGYSEKEKLKPLLRELGIDFADLFPSNQLTILITLRRWQSRLHMEQLIKACWFVRQELAWQSLPTKFPAYVQQLPGQKKLPDSRGNTTMPTSSRSERAPLPSKTYQRSCERGLMLNLKEDVTISESRR